MSDIIKNGVSFTLTKGNEIELEEDEYITWHIVGELLFIDSSTFNAIGKPQAKQLRNALTTFIGDEG